MTLQDIERFLKENAARLHRLGERKDASLGFNAFALVSDTYYRENFHSDIIRAILDPHSGHGEGALFLQKFVDFISTEARTTGKAKLADMLRNLAVDDSAEVTREEGRVDVKIKASEWTIIVENKINGAGDMFDLCKATGLRPPVFDIDARHFNVTVFRPQFDEQGTRIPAEVKAKTITNPSEVGPKDTEVGPYPEQVGPYPEQISSAEPKVSPKPIFDVVMSGYRKDFRETCAKVWECLAADNTVPRREMSVRLGIAESSVQSAMNALQEVGLLKREGYGKGRKWIVRNDAGREDNHADA